MYAPAPVARCVRTEPNRAPPHAARLDTMRRQPPQELAAHAEVQLTRLKHSRQQAAALVECKARKRGRAARERRANQGTAPPSPSRRCCSSLSVRKPQISTKATATGAIAYFVDVVIEVDELAGAVELFDEVHDFHNQSSRGFIVGDAATVEKCVDVRVLALLVGSGRSQSFGAKGEIVFRDMHQPAARGIAIDQREAAIHDERHYAVGDAIAGLDGLEEFPVEGGEIANVPAARQRGVVDEINGGMAVGILDCEGQRTADGADDGAFREATGNGHIG